MMTRTRYAVLATALAAALALGCGAGDTGAGTSPGGAPPAPARPAAATVPVGQPLTLTETLIGTRTVVVITVTNVKADVKSGNRFIQPDKGQYITADVTAQVNEGKYTINAAMFKLVAADGTAYDFALFGNNAISGNDITAGQKVTGTVAFDAAVGAEKGAKIALKSFLADGDAGYWQLP